MEKQRPFSLKCGTQATFHTKISERLKKIAELCSRVFVRNLNRLILNVLSDDKKFFGNQTILRFPRKKNNS